MIASVVLSTNIELILDYLQLHKLKRSTIFVFHCKNLQLHSSLGLDDKQTFFEKNGAKASAIPCICNFSCFFQNYKLKNSTVLCKFSIGGMYLVYVNSNKKFHKSFGHFWNSIWKIITIQIQIIHFMICMFAREERGKMAWFNCPLNSAKLSSRS